jgi:hypothetical protein
LRLIQANVLSTIHLFGRTSKPAASDRFTICSFHAPVRQTTSAIFSPAYPPTISKDALDEREQPSCTAQQVEGAVAILNISGMNDNAQQETQRVDQDVPLATFDLLARVVA